MQFDILTLFPDVITHYTSASIIGRAVGNQLITVNTVNPRDFTTNIHNKVDDTPYGGGSGMVLQCQPVDDAFESLKPLKPKHRILLTTPAGKKFDHQMAVDLSQEEQIIIFCGHYEGFDERILDLIPDIEEVSIGDFVLTGGELPALCMIDALTRLVPGAVQKAESVESDSFYNGLLDFPHYTRPADYKGLKVPDVLLSGDHQAINNWRKKQSEDRTQSRRPDLL